MAIETALLATGSGSLVGFLLGLTGGGGSVLAVPLLLYLVGMPSPHAAIGTAALAVAVNAFGNFAAHWRAGNVKLPCATAFALAGVLGAVGGAMLGKVVDGQKLILAFAGLMVVVAIAMLLPRRAEGDPTVRLSETMALRLVPMAALTGGASGFFGIGGGFMVVPALTFASGMPILNAIGSSLLSVGSFGLATALTYAASGLVDWGIAAVFIGGGIAGGVVGTRLAGRLAKWRGALGRLLAAIILIVAAYIVSRSLL